MLLCNALDRKHEYNMASYYDAGSTVCLDCGQVLLALKSDVEDRGTKADRTPLMKAASAGYVDIVRLLLAHNAQVNAQAPSGKSLVTG